MLNKPLLIAIAVLALLLGVQTWRLSSAHVDIARAETAHAQLVAGVATARAEGEAEGARRQKAAQDQLNAAHATMIAQLEADNVALRKHYDVTYGMLKDLAGQDHWSCLKDPLPENILKEFR